MHRVLASPVHFTWTKLLETGCSRLGVSRRATARTFWGDDMQVVLPERVSIFIHRYGYFETGLTKIFLEYVKPGMTVFDIGAHFGYFTLLASTLVGDAGQVHAFDPTPSTFELLRANSAQKKNVHPQNLAVYSTDTTISFNDYGLTLSAFNSLHGAKLDDAASLKAKKYDVKAVALDHYVQSSGVKPDFIKVDAEGAELDILRGMERTLLDVRPMLTMEMGDLGSAGPSASRAVVDFLLARGYRAMEHRDGRIVPHEPLERYGYDNLLFLPPSHPVATAPSQT
jgi:FkbM family methyltransferase